MGSRFTHAFGRSFYVTRARASFEGYRMLPKTGVDKRVLNRFEQLIGCVRYPGI